MRNVLSMRAQRCAPSLSRYALAARLMRARIRRRHCPSALAEQHMPHCTQTLPPRRWRIPSIGLPAFLSGTSTMNDIFTNLSAFCTKYGTVVRLERLFWLVLNR